MERYYVRMKLSYAIGVCTEAKELYNLLVFLKEVKRPMDEIVVIKDSGKVTPQVQSVLDDFSDVIQADKEFKGDFSEHKNFFSTVCSGDYIFNIDADEIPQEILIRSVEKLISQENPPDFIAIPRINICPGFTQNFLKKHNFSCNEFGWINWPDYQGRVYHRDLKWMGKVHEKIEGFKRPQSLEPHPRFSLWHIKSTTKQNQQNQLYSTIV